MPASAATSTAPLPFTPTIAERSNDRNDGTTFEPCTSYSESELFRLGAVAASVSDAAFSDSPNYRGCHWDSVDGLWTFSQIVGNEQSLETYKLKQSHRTWLPERSIHDRRVAVALDPPAGCFAVFISKRAIVVSEALSSTKRTPEPDFKTECDMAVAFATLATTKAP